ncbi:hypothetical protein EPUL_004820, partial [Erysiphe pulchra]
VANFAAADSLTSQPCVRSHTRPNKGNGKGKDKEMNTNTNTNINMSMNTTKKVAVATPKNILSQSSNRASMKEAEQLRVMPTTINSWAIVARNIQKKARTTYTHNLPVNTGIRGTQKLSNDEKSAPKVTDQRLFVRLPIEHEGENCLLRAYPVHSGFALSPCSTEARETILNAVYGLFLSGAKLKSATNWVSVLIPTVSLSIHKQQGEVEINSSPLSDEIGRVCSVRPAYVKLYGRNKPEAPHRTWMAFFVKAPRSGFRRCNGHHLAKNCSRAPSYSNCGSANYATDRCMAATKCRNCGGPHRSDSRRCLARPTRSGAPTKEQMKIYRQAGDREYQAVLRAKAAEENINTANCINANLTNTPHDPSAVQSLLKWTQTPRTIAIGDFNSVYWAWQPSARSYYGQGEEIEGWAEAHNLTFLIVASTKILPTNSSKLKVSKANLPQFTRIISQLLPPLRPLETTEETEKFSQYLSWALESALKAVAVEESVWATRAKTLRAVVASAKREHWKRKVEYIKSSRDVYKLMRWAAPQHASINPPLRHEGRFIEDQGERAIILRDCLLARFSSLDDLPPCIFPAKARIPWSDELTELEVRSCPIGSGNTSPGADGILGELPAACWKSIGLHVAQLFRAYIRFGVNSSCFKLAEIVFLSKAKRDPS